MIDLDTVETLQLFIFKLSLVSQVAAGDELRAHKLLRHLLLAAFSVYFKGLVSCRFLNLKVTDDMRFVASV